MVFPRELLINFNNILDETTYFGCHPTSCITVLCHELLGLTFGTPLFQNDDKLCGS
jgi:hypothetical protein